MQLRVQTLVCVDETAASRLNSELPASSCIPTRWAKFNARQDEVKGTLMLVAPGKKGESLTSRLFLERKGYRALRSD